MNMEIEWQPMETAPRDGSAVLLAIPDLGRGPTTSLTVGAYDGRQWVSDASSALKLYEPVFWAPLPEGPEMTD